MPVEFIAVRAASDSSSGYKKFNDKPHLKTKKGLGTFN